MKFQSAICLLLSIAKVEGITEDKVESTIRDLQESKSYLDQNALSNPSSYQSKALNAAVSSLTDSAKLATFLSQNPERPGNFDWEDKHIKNFYAAATIYYATNGVANEKTEEQLGDDFEVPGWDEAAEWISNPDYCSWFGVTCFLDTQASDIVAQQSEEQNIIEIQLFNNTLYGTWPQEVGLLGDSLATIDIFDNFYQSLTDYTFFESMNALQYLYFGTTSWEASGVPAELNKLTNLVQLDCSYSFWSEGPIRDDAFRSLSKLQYIDMGDNIYKLDGSQEIPDSMRTLPSLIRLYFDNVRFINDNRDDVSFPMDFLTEMESVIEAWFDFTKFSGGIPELPAALKSFSCIFCGLEGNLDNLAQAGWADLNRVWLTGNKLTGTIPEAIGDVNTDMSLIYLEGNELTSTRIPQSLCVQAVAGSDQKVLNEIGADQELCTDADSCCTCVAFDCGNTPDATPAPTPVAPDIPFGICFSGNNMVNVENRGAVKMADLAIGDMVMVGENQFEPIYSFGHKNDSASAEYIRITTDATKQPLEISAAHMITIEGDRNVPASAIKNGDMLQTASGDLAAVKNIKTVIRQGAYAPFTNSGKVIVNDIVASNYIAYQGSEHLKIGDVETSLSYQWVAHTFNSAHRLAVMLGFDGETYTESGVSHWVDMPHTMFQWLLEQNVFVSSVLIFFSLTFFGLTSILEFLFSNPVSMAVTVGMSTIIAYRKIGSKCA